MSSRESDSLSVSVAGHFRSKFVTPPESERSEIEIDAQDRTAYENEKADYND